MQLPQTFVETWAHEPEWLETIPGLLRELADDWNLDLEGAIDTPYSLVVPAGDAVLKLNAPPTSRPTTRPTRSSAGTARELCACWRAMTSGAPS